MFYTIFFHFCQLIVEHEIKMLVFFQMGNMVQNVLNLLTVIMMKSAKMITVIAQILYTQRNLYQNVKYVSAILFVTEQSHVWYSCSL